MVEFARAVCLGLLAESHSEANCLRFALAWHARLAGPLTAPNPTFDIYSGMAPTPFGYVAH
jgi:hypothetical protein